MAGYAPRWKPELSIDIAKQSSLVPGEAIAAIVEVARLRIEILHLEIARKDKIIQALMGVE